MTPPPAYPHGQLASGGRWERLLRALADHPDRLGPLAARTDPGRYERRRERSKVHVAIKAMAGAGLVARTADGWAITAHGTEALARLDRASGESANGWPTPEGRTA
jgi:hypothetical protein